MQDDSKIDNDLQALAAESMGWQPLGDGAYMHCADDQGGSGELIIQVVGLPDVALMGQNVLLVTG